MYSMKYNRKRGKTQQYQHNNINIYGAKFCIMKRRTTTFNETRQKTCTLKNKTISKTDLKWYNNDKKNIQLTQSSRYNQTTAKSSSPF